ncbi:response regulator transcription factor [Novosphingobium lentum]|uniref:response regulator transcription factor n=1 Tax=Novosphingobium lentum TaxID=145287 RepID=UPI000833B466|nr:response regulator transcription factor [Novosphingobium lentum]
MNRILAVDDEPAILRLLGAVLGRGGYDVVPASDAAAAMAALARGGIDAIVLDLGLPDRDGLEVIAAVRASSQVPIIVVTARSDVAEKIAALDLGADDYVTKPFDGDELLARLRSALRRARPDGRSAEQLVHGPLRIDFARHVLTRDNAPVALTPREFAVMGALIEAGGRIVTHAALLEKVWGKAHVHDVDYLRVVVRALRLKLEADPAHPDLIRNEPGIGYRLTDA